MSKKQLKELLVGDRWLAQLSDEARDKMFAAAHLHHFIAGQLVHSKGDSADGLYAIVSGEIKFSSTTIDGNEIILTRLTAGNWFGEVALLDGGERSYDVHTTVESLLVSIPKSSIDKICRHHVEVYRALVYLNCQHVRQAFAALNEFLSLNAEQRLVKRLFDQYPLLKKHSFLAIGQQEMANNIGVSRQSINKILRGWQKLKWIKRCYGGIEILSVAGLKTLLNE